MRKWWLCVFTLPALCLFVGCTFTTKQQGTIGVRVLAGEWGIELFHETPDTDEASINLNIDKALMDWFVDNEQTPDDATLVVE